MSDGNEKDKTNPSDDGASVAASSQKDKKEKKPVDELSAEDKALKESLELLVLRVRDSIAGVARLGMFIHLCSYIFYLDAQWVPILHLFSKFVY